MLFATNVSTYSTIHCLPNWSCAASHVSKHHPTRGASQYHCVRMPKSQRIHCLKNVFRWRLPPTFLELLDVFLFSPPLPVLFLSVNQTFLTSFGQIGVTLTSSSSFARGAPARPRSPQGFHLSALRTCWAPALLPTSASNCCLFHAQNNRCSILLATTARPTRSLQVHGAPVCHSPYFNLSVGLKPLWLAQIPA